MTTLTTIIRFELDSRLNETATIEQDDNGTWGFTTTRGYNSWEGDGYKSFDAVYNKLKAYEKESIKDLKYA